MNWQQQIFLYCERGADPAFWAEPLNAISNAAFIAAGLAGLVALVREPGAEGVRGRMPEAGLVLLVLVIGVGSFLFHTYATRWAQLADVIPIAVFMLAYLAYVLGRFMGLNLFLVALGLVLFYGAMQYAGTIQCAPSLMPITAAAGARCLNGSLAYSPAAATLLVVAGALAVMRHPAWRLLMVAAVIFAVSMGLRTIDLEVCAATRTGLLAGPMGTHFVWHLLNAVTLYLLLLAAVRHGSRAAQQQQA